MSSTGLLVQVEMRHGQIEYRLIETVPVSQSSRTSYSICWYSVIEINPMSHNPAEYMFRLTYCTIVLFCVQKRKTSFCISRNKRINFFVGGEGGISEAPLFLNTGRLVLKRNTVFSAWASTLNMGLISKG